MCLPSILVVEDNGLLRWWITRTLQDEGFPVVSPASMDAAVHLAATTPFDVLITDCRLGNQLDGFQVLEKVRTTNPATQAILISGEDCEPLKGRASAGGFDRIIEKPFSLVEILDAIRSLVAPTAPQEVL